MEDTIYCYPGTDVLVNKLDIHDADLLQNAERDLTARRLIQLQDHLIQGNFRRAEARELFKRPDERSLHRPTCLFLWRS